MAEKSSFQKKEFITESAIKKREQEWEQVFEKVKQSKLTAAETKVDTDPRSLFEKLQEQKLKKEEAIQEEYKLSNRIHRLDEEEVSFLQDWKESKAAQSAKAKEEETIALADYRQQKSKMAGTLVLSEEKEEKEEKEELGQKKSGLKAPLHPSQPPVLSKQKKLLSIAVRPKTTATKTTHPL